MGETETLKAELEKTREELRAVKSKRVPDASVAESQERFYIAAEQTGSLIYDHNIDTGEIEFSGAIEKITGHPPHEFAKTTIDKWKNHIHPDDIEHFEKSALAVEQAGARAPIEYRINRKNGGLIYVEDSGFFLKNAQGRVFRVIGTIRDITRHKHIERDLMSAKQSAEQANTAKSRFLANMSHEIRTPMNAVIGFSDILSKTKLTKEQKECADTIRESGKMLISLIDDIIDISKLEENRLEFENISFNTRDMLKNAAQIAEPAAREKKLDFRYSVTDTTPEILKGDPVRVRQIVLNLLSNAVKFTEKGEVAVSVDGIAHPDDETVILNITVRDTGIGIPKNKLNAIFNIFTQADESYTRRYGGSGLGLSIVKSLAEKMNGSITVDSREGKGSIFFVTLKLGSSLAEDKKAVSPSADVIEQLRHIARDFSLIGKKILIVEDNAVNLKLVEKLLAKMGCLSDTAVNGLEALKKIRANEYHAILMDIQMPEMNGLDAARAIRKDINSQIPIIALTAAAMKKDRDNAKDAGMNDYLTKPLEHKKLEEMLKKWIGLQ